MHLLKWPLRNRNVTSSSALLIGLFWETGADRGGESRKPEPFSVYRKKY
jgi:hypothetical protein